MEDRVGLLASQTMPGGGQNSTDLVLNAAEHNAASYEAEAREYAGRVYLEHPEFAILRRFRGRWDSLSVLDIGVGAGRTAYTLTAVASSYVGVDYAESMIEMARRAITEDERTSFHVGDARDLSFLGDRRFGLVLFSYNGIDSVGHDDRQKILSEMRKHTAEDGLCAFSSHSLKAVPLEVPKLRWPKWRSLYSIAESLGDIQRKVRIREINRSVDIPAAREHGWTQIVDEDPSYVTFYVDPETQRQQLEAAGFELVDVLDFQGRAVSPSAHRSDVWLHYVCRPRASG